MHSLGSHTFRGNNKAEIQKTVSDIIKEMSPDDTVTISFERKEDQEALIKELSRQGIIL